MSELDWHQVFKYISRLPGAMPDVYVYVSDEGVVVDAYSEHGTAMARIMLPSGMVEGLEGRCAHVMMYGLAEAWGRDVRRLRIVDGRVYIGGTEVGFISHIDSCGKYRDARIPPWPISVAIKDARPLRRLLHAIVGFGYNVAVLGAYSGKMFVGWIGEGKYLFSEDKLTIRLASNIEGDTVTAVGTDTLHDVMAPISRDVVTELQLAHEPYYPVTVHQKFDEGELYTVLAPVELNILPEELYAGINAVTYPAEAYAHLHAHTRYLYIIEPLLHGHAYFMPQDRALFLERNGSIMVFFLPGHMSYTLPRDVEYVAFQIDMPYSLAIGQYIDAEIPMLSFNEEQLYLWGRRAGYRAGYPKGYDEAVELAKKAASAGSGAETVATLRWRELAKLAKGVWRYGNVTLTLQNTSIEIPNVMITVLKRKRANTKIVRVNDRYVLVSEDAQAIVIPHVS